MSIDAQPAPAKLRAYTQSGRWRVLAAALMVLCCSVAGAALDRSAFSFRAYDLDLRLDPAAQAVSARGKITVSNISSEPQTALALQISSTLLWRLVQIDGQPVQFVTQPYTTDIDHTGSVSEAVITLPQPLAPGASIEVEVGYSGTLSADVTRLTRAGTPQQTAERSDWDQLSDTFTAVRGVGHVVWYPVSIEAALLRENRLFSTLGDWQARQAQSSMRARFCWIAEGDEDEEDDADLDPGPDPAANPAEAPSGLRLTVVANGELENIGQRGPQADPADAAITGCSSYRFTNLGLKVPLFVIGEFQVLTRAAVTVYHMPENRRFAESYAAAVERVLPWVTGWLGAPRQKLQIVELSEPALAPYESGAMLLVPFANISLRELENMLVHQAVHAAFFSSRPWIYEGLAQFAQAWWRESQGSRRSALDFMQLQLPALVEAEKQACAGAVSNSADLPSAPASPASANTAPNNAAAPPSQAAGSAPALLAPSSSLNCPQGRSLVSAYDELYPRIKGMYVWWMLRDIVGPAALQGALKSYQPAEDIEPSYIQRLLSRPQRNLAQRTLSQRNLSQRDLEPFFDDWVYRDRGLPDFRVQNVYPRETLAGGFVVTVSVENVGGASGDVLVRVLAPQGERSQKLSVPTRGQATVRIEIAARPTEVILNDGSVPESDTRNNRLPVR